MITLNGNEYFEYKSMGEFRSDTEWIHGSRTIDSYELIVVLDGMVHIEEENIRYCLSEGDMLILEPGKFHRGYKKSETATAFYWLHFDTNIPIPFKMYSGAELYDIKMLTKRLLHISNSPKYNKSDCDAAAYIVFRELYMCCDSSAEVSTALSHRIAEYIRINTDTRLTAGDIATYFGYNSDYIGKIFKKCFGTGIKDYICNQKIKKAKNLLLMTNMTIKEISAAVGYEDDNLFIKFFRYHEEITPTLFRNRYKGTHMNNK